MRAFASAILLGSSLVCSAALPAQAGRPEASQPASATVTVPQLPTPDGKYGIGRTAYDWTDATRPDRYSTNPQAHRELMVYVWYPAAEAGKDVRGVYIPGAKRMDANPEVRQALKEDYGANWARIVSGAIYSHAQEGAPPAMSESQFPLLVFSPGMGGFSFGYTSLIEDLVSHGYAVAAIEFTYNAPVVFPDGRVVPVHREPFPRGLPPDEALKRMAEMAGKGITEGAADMRFVLDQLIELKNKPGGNDPVIAKLDVKSVVAIGHSAGGAFAARACQLDARFKACIDLDGGMVPVAALPDFSDGAQMKQPLLFLEGNPSGQRMFGTPEQLQGYFKKKEEQLQSCPRGSFLVDLQPPRIDHGSFSDDPVLEAKNPADTDQGLHNLDLIETYIRAFLSRTLRGDRTTVLDGSSTLSPEVTIRAYGH